MRNVKPGINILSPFIISLVAGCLLLSVPATAEEEKAKAGIESKKEEYQKIQKEIEEQSEKVEKAGRREHSILEELDRTNQELTEVQVELRKQRERLRAVEGEIRKVKAEISSNKAKLERQKEWLNRKLRIMQRHGYSGDVILLLSTSDDISQLMRRWRYIKALASYDHKMLQGYKETLNNLDNQGKRLNSLRAEMKETEEDIEVKAAELAEKKRDKEILLISVKKEKSSYEKMLRELKDASRRLLEIIRQSEETGAYEAKGFQSLKGRLPWPVNGRVVTRYGVQKDPKFKTPVFKNGIHIKAEDDTTAKAVYDGKIVFAEWFKGYGQLIIINHGGGYHTLYANLAEIFYKVGDIIKEQQAIGRVGESGTLSTSGLYFEIRYKGKPLDPLQWLKRK